MDPNPTAAQDGPVPIGFVLVGGFPLMTYAAAVEPLRAANQLAGRALYSWWHVSPDGAPVAASNGIDVLPDAAIGDAGVSANRVFVCAGGNPSAFEDRRLFAWLRKLARRGVAIGGISGGPYILARAGLLEGRIATVHWEHIPAFSESFPRVHVTRSLFEIDRDRITCSGGTAALDLMLRLIAQDHGPELAVRVSEWFLHNQIREGLSPQRMALPLRLGVRDPRLVRVLETMEANLEQPLDGAALARAGGLSLRQLERLFRSTLGHGLHRHYLGERLDRAMKLERETTMPMSEIAAATGFASTAALRRAGRRAETRTAAPARENAGRPLSGI